ncbi:hypothetical protein [Ectobacillus ponti]|uniref:YopA central domain-containing protein n=1 Tax=Ectobacillus ponti TaxID=2961894 RepID=A0AA41X8M1_9BACI|nr:hypothetical protein [Ectobacillus ponti]MCP8970802.1 hypothetical protein [Ectobacillus ponti]
MEQEDKKFYVNGRVYLNWLPAPSINFEAEMVDDVNIDMVINKILGGSYRLTTRDGYSCSVMVTNIKYGDKFAVTGIVLNFIERPGSETHQLVFSVVNFINDFGSPIQHERTMYLGRSWFKYGAFRIVLDKQPDYKTKYDELTKTGGYAITHAGMIEHIEGELFSYDEVADLLESLMWLLSFASGRKVGICSVHGYIGEELVLERYQAPIIFKWKKVNNWFPKTDPDSYLQLQNVYPSLVKQLKDDLWGDVLKRTLSWYFDSNDARYVENKIVAVQIALETLAWTFLVEEHEIVARSVFDKKLRASDKLVRLLHELSIPQVLPDTGTFAAAQKFYENGPHLLTDFRNEIVHPSKKAKKNGQTIAVPKHRVLELGKQYLELSILRILNYKGKYQNLLKEVQMVGETVENVPWCSKKSET